MLLLQQSKPRELFSLSTGELLNHTKISSFSNPFSVGFCRAPCLFYLFFFLAVTMGSIDADS